VLVVISATTLQLLGFTQNGTTVDVWGCTGTNVVTITTILTYFTYTCARTYCSPVAEVYALTSAF